MEKENEVFKYNYSANQHQEIKNIKQKYIPREENKLLQLRKLDESLTRKGTIWSLIIGVISSLVLGIGLCFTLVWKDYFILGIFIGIIGLIGMSLAYYVYSIITEKQRKKLAPIILKLCEEIEKSN